MHLVATPFALVDALVLPSVNSFSMDVVAKELSDVVAAVCPLESTDAVLLSLVVVALVLGVVWPHLNTVAVLTVFNPLADVLRTVKMLVRATPMRFVIQPFSFVDIAVCVD